MTAFDKGRSKTAYPGRALPKPEKVKDAVENKTAVARATDAANVQLQSIVVPIKTAPTLTVYPQIASYYIGQTDWAATLAARQAFIAANYK